MFNIKPTRSELIKLRKKIKLAHMGYDLLKRKKDGLIQEFFQILDDVKKNRTLLAEIYKHGTTKLELARAMDGLHAIEAAAFAMKHEPEISLTTKNIMGVSVPKIKADFLEKELETEYGIIGTSSYIDDLIACYNEVLKKVVINAELETGLKRLLLEIEKTRRRVSALEHVVIPDMENAANFIMLRLEELERENLFRLKRIKAK